MTDNKLIKRSPVRPVLPLKIFSGFHVLIFVFFQKHL